jgi:hypothetical protein
MTTNIDFNSPIETYINKVKEAKSASEKVNAIGDLIEIVEHRISLIHHHTLKYVDYLKVKQDELAYWKRKLDVEKLVENLIEIDKELFH